MSNSPYGTAPQPVLDPTAVTGKRVLAWIIDGIIYVVLTWLILIVVLGLSARSAYVPTGQTSTDFCAQIEQQQPHTRCVDTSNSNSSTNASATQPKVLILSNYYPGRESLVFLALFVVFCLVQGVLGGSLGKLSMGLRIVKPDGSQAGIGASFIRTIMWIVDAITCGIPLVGLVTMLSTKGHRRVGDMAASTFVVDQHHVGNPVILPGDPRYGYMGPSGFGTQPPGGYGTPTGSFGTQPGGYGNQPGGFGSQPGGFGMPVGTQPYGQSGLSGNYEADKPVWDDTRNTYIQFDTQRQAWLEFDQASQEWQPISTDQPGQSTHSGPESVPFGQGPPPESATPQPSSPEPTLPQPTSPEPTSPPASTPPTQDETNRSSSYQADKPVWDEARNAYIQFDTQQNSWLEYDDKAKKWKPISSS